MALKNVRLTRAEKLTPATREQHNLPAKGLVIIESRNPDLKEKFVAVGEEGIHGYLLSLGTFKDAEE